MINIFASSFMTATRHDERIGDVRHRAPHRVEEKFRPGPMRGLFGLAKGR